MQEAYIRGVSGWNFDVAALKRNANEEGPGLERLSTIAETPGPPSHTNPSPFYTVLCCVTLMLSYDHFLQVLLSFSMCLIPQSHQKIGLVTLNTVLPGPYCSMQHGNLHPCDMESILKA